MKKYVMTALLTTAAVCAQAQSKPEPYFSFRELPNMLKWAPAPPDTMGAAFTYDIMQYMWGKEMRQNKERADIAIRDAVYSLECIAQEFSEPFGLTISEENTPEIWKLLRDAKATCENISGFPKYYYKRKRPFVRFQEPTATPQFEPELRRNFSYPSVPIGRATWMPAVWPPLPPMPGCTPATVSSSRCAAPARNSRRSVNKKRAHGNSSRGLFYSYWLLVTYP